MGKIITSTTERVHVVIIPGLGNEIQKHIWVSDMWRKSGIIPHVFDAKWKTEEKGFRKKLGEALSLVDSLIKTGKKVSIIGNSAGSSPSFRESVLLSERVISELSVVERKRILTLRPLFDEVVPPWTVPIEGATNEITPAVEHVATITLNMTLSMAGSSNSSGAKLFQYLILLLCNDYKISVRLFQ